jgi:excisionase family DNA binding protein
MKKSQATMTVVEAAELLGISRNSAYDAARIGQLPTIKIGKRILVSRTAIERMLETAGGSVPSESR